ncbi:MAG: tRNA (guanosine(37)-N1)-methyltransferase TrmD [Candidatus Goldbacteria bacterium]|nr:tRNA (guanosine(37)-N1)-methyltransferase TrmD [Candidatus Goldiibacteriota bacterium]
MKIFILTIFPDIFKDTLSFSILKKAKEKGKVDYIIINIRDFTLDKHKTTDDVPYGGLEGMVMKVEPIYNALLKIKEDLDKNSKTKILLLSASGKKLTQEKLRIYSQMDNIILICGRYEGVDERVINFVDEEISIGDYVLSGGEFPAMVLIEGIVRLIPGVLGNKQSIENESFNNGLLDYPQYTRPREFKGFMVPEILLSGNHEEIKKWRRREAIKKTYMNRPDLLDKINLTDEDKKILNEIKKGDKNE